MVHRLRRHVRQVLRRHHRPGRQQPRPGRAQGRRQNIADYQIADQESEHWRTRDLAARAAGTDTPLLFTQGLLEWNTEPEAVQEFLDNHQGPERGWLGPWDHKRGNERTADGRLEMGRATWFEETMSFYDQYLKGIAPAVEHPAHAVQDNTGTWRAQDTWPVVERAATVALGGGTYVDDGIEGGYLTRSEPLAETTRITGTPRITLTAEGHGNVMLKLYDVAPDGTAVLFDQQVSLLRPGPMAVDLKSTDWTLQAGHSLAVGIGTITPGPDPLFNDWVDTPSGETITIDRAELELAFGDPADDTATAGDRAPWLDIYLSVYTSPLPVGTPAFTVPTSTP